MIRKFFVHTGRHRPGPQPLRVPFVCLNCEDGYHHGNAPVTWPCECLCADSENQSIRETVNIQPSWWERLSSRATQFRDWAQRPYVPRPAAGHLVSDGRGQPAAGPGHTRDEEACPNCGRWGFDGTLCDRCGWGYGWQPAYHAKVTAVMPPGVRVSGTLTDDSGIIRMAPRGRRCASIWQPPQRPLEPWIQALLGAPTVADAMRDIITGSLRPALAAA